MKPCAALIEVSVCVFACVHVPGISNDSYDNGDNHDDDNEQHDDISDNDKLQNIIK